MNNQEAKFILSGYRPGGRDAGDARFAEALMQAQNDPALGVWLARGQAHDAAVAAKLAEIVPPAGLREAILAGAKMSGAGRVAWRRPLWFALAAAAAVMVGITAALWPNRSAAQIERLADFALTDTGHERHGGQGEPSGALQAMLAQPANRLGSVPMDFEKLRATGCRTVSLAGKDVLEVCFRRNGVVFHLYMMRRADFPQLPSLDKPVIVQRDGLCCANWAEAGGRLHFVVVTDSGAEAIRNLL